MVDEVLVLSGTLFGVHSIYFLIIIYVFIEFIGFS